MDNIFINRELSWLSFNARVLQEASDPAVPLVERMKFLGIYSNNMDEFFKVRVATIKRMIDLKIDSKKILGEKPKKLMHQVQAKVIEMQAKSQQTYHDILLELEREKIYIVDETQLSPKQQEFVVSYFNDRVLSAISPIMFSNVDKFPYLEDRAIYLAAKLTRANGDFEYAIVDIPTAVLPRFIELPNIGDKKYIILLDDIIRFNIKDVFAIFKYEKYETYTIKLTRDAELDIDNDLTKSFLEKISKSVTQRRTGQPVRFVFDSDIPKDLLKYLVKQLELNDDDNLIPGGRYHNFKDFMSFPNVGSRGLEYVSAPPLSHPLIHTGKSILKVIDGQDVLLHFPYQKFTDYINLLREAAIDPDVKCIKITLYRVAKNSRVIGALMNAVQNGKDVTVIIELQARFDENSNIYWARRLEEIGARVLFGIPRLKVHSKLTLISRRVGKRIRHYSVVGTGNFHEGNAVAYTDVSLLTADQRIGREVDKLFDYFENPFKYPVFNHLLVSPQFMRRKVYALIDEEIRNVKAGREAWIMVKINNLVDTDVISKLYQASQAGVSVRMVVRGICSLIPGIAGLSENIEAVSIVGRYLEHSRIFIFCNGGAERYYISSADWMTRNLDTRIEIAAPIYDLNLQKEMKYILETQLRDNVKARIIDAVQDNRYKRDDNPPLKSQTALYEHYRDFLETGIYPENRT
ncbi:MAG: polyphosphate kinase 1 [Bacteroidales bacterium]|jgi:polyphosphate kinase|nr:polyphosphate kinase 1 [Bacteroidales bacterium]